ncbi:MAG: BglG family transcription antiterminator [Lachnospiraceae bacterium]|nr:BglG family transcription antiterminator [Lachnospiraceae bacterium]
MKNKRWLDILYNLDGDEAVSSESLSNKLLLSSRTIRNELRELKTVLEKEGAHLISSTKVGYLLVVEDQEKYDQFLKTLGEEETIPVTSEERVQYLLEVLLTNGQEYVKLEDLCDQLYVSKSTLTANLKEVRKLLDEYGLELITRPGYGIQVKGSEFSLRLCLAASAVAQLETDDETKRAELEKIAKCTLKGLEDSRLKISEASYQNLIVHIYIAIKRIQEGNHVPLEKTHMEQISKEMEFGCAQQISSLLEEAFSIEIPRTETGYIAIHLASKRIMECSHNDGNLVINDEIYEIVHHMLEVIKENYNIDFHNDLELIMLLAAHLVPFSTRIQYGMKLKNPLLSEIKSHYAMAYMMAVTACGFLEQYYEKRIQEDEIGYFAFPINLALERRRSGIEKKNIIVVCSTGRGSSQLLSYRLKSEFGKYINQITTCDVLELKQVDLKDIDYVITTVPIPYPVNRPILHVKLFLENADTNAIENLLRGKGNTLLEKYFHPDLFLTELQAASKQEVIERMVEKIHQVKNVPEEFLESVLERERMAVTSFGNLAAIPHPNRALTRETFVCVAVLKNPIQWDKQKVQVVLMLSLQKDTADNTQHLIAVISKLLFHTGCIKELIRNPNYSVLLQLLERMEKETEE